MRVGRGTTFDCPEPNSIGTGLRQLNRSKIDNHLRRDVAAGVADLVEQLFDRTGNRNTAARIRVFCYYKATVRLRFDDGVADICEVGDALPIGLTVSSRALRATLDHMPRHHTRSK